MGCLVASSLTKICTKCGKIKPANAEAFAVRKGSSDGLASWCRPCCRVANQRWRQKPGVTERQRLFDIKRRQRPEYKEASNARSKKRHADPVKRARKRELARKTEPKRMLARKDKFNEWRREHRKNNPAYYAAMDKKRVRSIDKVREYQRKTKAKRRSTVEGKINHRISSAILQCLKSASRGKQGRRWECLVGYSIDDLKSHLERQFVKGMNWENMGGWHIDHIVPLSRFRFIGPDDPEFRAAWAMANLRPLWAAENIKKHARRTLLL